MSEINKNTDANANNTVDSNQTAYSEAAERSGSTSDSAVNYDSDHEYIKKMFDADGITAPDSLSEEKILALIRDMPGDLTGEISGAVSEYMPQEHEASHPDHSGEPAGNQSGDRSGADSTAGKPERVKRRQHISPAVKRRIMAVAACFIIASISIPLVNAVLTAAPDTSLVDGELRTFDSYGQIKRLVRSMEKQSGIEGGGGIRILNLGRDDETMDIMTEDAVGDAAGESAGEAESYDAAVPNGLVSEAPVGTASEKSAASGASDTGADPGSSHSSTYLQVNEVDEADIVKTDGKYIYYVTDREEVVILSAKKGKTKQLARIGSSGVENYIHDIFLKENILVTIGRTYREDDSSTAIVTYDISDRSHPEMIREFRQSGDIVSSRMVGSCVYLVTTDYVSSSGRIIPQCTIGNDYTDIPVEEIRCIPDPQSASYVILSSVDIASVETVNSKTCAVFGTTDSIYCNDHNLYTASSEYNAEKNSWYTRISRASIDGLDISFNATTSVRGNILNQFSMDEYNGYFRIATTSQRDGMDVNNLFVLDGKLKIVGEISGFARNESIKSVRFMGDTAYVITYQAIDPLFVIDLSRADDPRILGEVKIDGFSSMLVPIGRNKVLGIGYATGDNGYGGEYAAGLKLALFDTSDPAEPKVLDSREFENMDSPAQSTHLALTVNTDKGYYAIPYGVDHYEEFAASEPDDVMIEDQDQDDAEVDETYEAYDQYEGGVLVFSASDKLEVNDQHMLGTEYLTRCVYIGDYIYAMDQTGGARSFRLKLE